jgi:ribonuclease PH
MPARRRAAPAAPGPDALRPVRIRRGVSEYAEGSALIEQGRTRVLCTASVEARVPPWLEGQDRGWVTAEYAMLPRSTHTRKPRAAVRGKPDSRALEISRLVGRSLRAAVDLAALPGQAVTVDCDVLQADGGTRCAAITGGMVALADAFRWMKREKRLAGEPLRELVAAVSVGIVDGRPVLDLAYEEDSAAAVDMNVVMTEGGRYVEIQGTGEARPFTERELAALRRLAASGIASLVEIQKTTLRKRSR